MDRNVVIATVLIAIIMLVWMVWLAPPPGEVPSAQEPPADTAAVAAQQEAVVAAPPDPLAPDTTLLAPQAGTARLITVETDLYEAQFSTKGATLVSFRLKEYTKFDQQTPVQLVDTTGVGALALFFQTPSSHNVDTRSIFFDTARPQERIVVTEGADSLVFFTRIGEATLRQTYVFTPNSYEIGLRVGQDNPAAFTTSEGYELVWNGGLPPTEGDLENEARSTGAFARSGGEVEEVSLNSDPEEELRLSGVVEWTAVKNKYFTAVVIPDEETRGAELQGRRTGDAEAGTGWETYTTRLLMPPLTPGQPDSYRLYVGPMEFYRITDYDLGLYDMVDYGWDFFEWITRPLARFIFIPFFNFLGSFIPSYGLVIILFAILIKLLLYPLTKTSYTSMARMRELQPKMEAIKEKYADNPQKQQEAMMKMYRETGVNPLGGCLPMLLQYPIIIALWQYLPQSIEIRQQGFLWATDLSAPDAILHLPFTIPVYGNFVAGFTLLMGLSMVVQMKLSMTASVSNAQAKIFTYVFPVMIFAIFNKLAAGLSLYYLIYNVVSALQQKWINHQFERKREGRGEAEARPKVKSKPGSNGQSKGGSASKKVKT